MIVAATDGGCSSRMPHTRAADRWLMTASSPRCRIAASSRPSGGSEGCPDRPYPRQDRVQRAPVDHPPDRARIDLGAAKLLAMDQPALPGGRPGDRALARPGHGPFVENLHTPPKFSTDSVPDGTNVENVRRCSEFSTESVESARPARPARTARSTRPARTARPARPVRPARAARSARLARFAQTARAMRSARAARTPQPGPVVRRHGRSMRPWDGDMRPATRLLAMPWLIWHTDVTSGTPPRLPGPGRRPDRRLRRRPEPRGGRRAGTARRSCRPARRARRAAPRTPIPAAAPRR